MQYSGTKAQWDQISISSGNTALTSATISYKELTGKCGDSLTWTLHEDTGLLTIKGTGAMYNYEDHNTPWDNYKSQIRTVEIDAGATSVGDQAFKWCGSLASVSLPTTLRRIGDQAFSSCYSLTEITIPAGVTTIGSNAFIFCNALASVTIPVSVTDIGYAAFSGCNKLKTVQYSGTSTQWSRIQIGDYNDPLTEASISFNSSGSPSPTTVNPFTDVFASSPYYTAILWAYNNGIVRGTSDTTFSPDDSCTRVQFSLILYRLAGTPDVSGLTNPFRDLGGLSSGQKRAITWAYNRGIINGTSSTTFNPNGSVTRAQLVLMLYKMAGMPYIGSGSSSPFTDIYGLTTNNKNAVVWAYNYGVVKGTSSTTFSPYDPCTRGQLVLILYRIYTKTPYSYLFPAITSA